MGAWTDIKFRCVDIIEYDVAANGLSTHVYRTLPRSIDMGIMPCVLLLPQSDSDFEWSGGNRHTVNYILQMRLYIAPVNTVLDSVGQFDVEEYLDLFRRTFLSRPQLQFNDTALSGVAGNILFRTVSALTGPIEYPIGDRNSLYWGAIYQLTIPYRELIPVKVTGL